MKEKKSSATHQLLGEQRIENESTAELLPLFLKANDAMITKAGGSKKWDNLSEPEQNGHKSEMLANLTIELGKESFEKLPAKEKALFKLFVWVGCGCHKDLNTVLGGYTAMSQFWGDNNLEEPVLLPNKFNASIIQSQSADNENDDSDIAQKAIKNSTRGGIKAAKLAGEILNNKNDKSGHHDQFQIWWTNKTGRKFTFPDTSNTRFQSHCDAAKVLTLHRDSFIEYLEYAKEKKGQAQYSNMEENFLKALTDIPTQTELAVLALYSQAVSVPYMQFIRKDGSLNALDLGPTNQKITEFLQRIIEDPTFLIGPNITHETGTFNGTEWENKDLVEHVNKLAPELPYLKPALVAFCKGAQESWRRFTSEYAPGGLIDEATQEQKDFAWMPTTNDINEGALGQFCVMLRHQPQLTLLQYNAKTMFARNNTAVFMETYFSHHTDQYIWELACQPKTEEKARLQAIVEYSKQKIAKKLEKRKQKEAQAAELAKRIQGVQPIWDKAEIDALKGDRLKDQVKVFIIAGAPNLHHIKSSATQPQQKAAIKEAIDLFHAEKWVLKPGFKNHEGVIMNDIEDEDDEDSDQEIFEGYDEALGSENEWVDEED